MSDQNQPELAENKPFDQEVAGPIPRENPFRAISKMFRSSIGRLPAHLVIIFVLSLCLAVFAGVFLEWSEKEATRSESYLVKRLEPEEGAPSLTEETLRGVWVHEADTAIMTLRMGNGIFEFMAWQKKSPIGKSFIRGGYRMEGNVLILQQRKDLGTPLEVNHLEYRFFPVDFSDINLYAQSNGRIMDWNTPASEKARLTVTLPILEEVFGQSMAWVKIAAAP